MAIYDAKVDVPFIWSSKDYHEFEDVKKIMNTITSLELSYKEIGVFEKHYYAIFYENWDQETQRLYNEELQSIKNDE